MALKIGKYSFRSYKHTTRKPPSMKYGGWNGIVIFQDLSNGEMIVGRSTKLTTYLSEITFNRVKGCLFGKPVSMIPFEYLQVHFLEVENLSDLRKMQAIVQKEIVSMKKEKENKQLSLDLKPKRAIRKQPSLQHNVI